MLYNFYYICIFQNAPPQETYQQANQQRNHQRNPQNLQFPANKIDKTSYFMTQQMRMVSILKKCSVCSGTKTRPCLLWRGGFFFVGGGGGGDQINFEKV